MKTKSAFLITAAWLVVSLTGMAQADDKTAALSPAEIVKLSQAKYAALTSYSDEGTTVATIGALTANNYTSTTTSKS